MLLSFIEPWHSQRGEHLQSVALFRHLKIKPVVRRIDGCCHALYWPTIEVLAEEAGNQFVKSGGGGLLST